MLKPTEQTSKELQYAYDYFNKHLFEGELPPCLITYQRYKKSMGYFSKDRYINKFDQITDEIALNPEYFLSRPTIEIFQTLVHEMCHLWQAHYGKSSRRTYHNKEWGNKMESIGLMPSNTGLPNGKKTGQSMNDYPITNGKFIKSALSLVKKGFFITWYDREYVITSNSNDTLEWEENLIENVKNDKNEQAINTLISKPIDINPNVLNMSDIKKNNKTKYTCSCGINLWGGKFLDIKCNVCKCDFIKID